MSWAVWASTAIALQRGQPLPRQRNDLQNTAATGTGEAMALGFEILGIALTLCQTQGLFRTAREHQLLQCSSREQP